MQSNEPAPRPAPVRRSPPPQGLKLGPIQRLLLWLLDARPIDITAVDEGKPVTFHILALGKPQPPAHHGNGN